VPFVANSGADRAAMLAAVGAKGIEELFADIPAARRFPKLDLPEPLSELEVLREIEAMAARNRSSAASASFLGAGAYDHFIPSLVSAIASRGEFLTAYTPYQPEVSQGTLQAIFEYQSMAASLLGMEVVNASHYDGATALAEAVLMAYHNASGRGKVLLPAALHPEYKAVVRTYLAAFPVQVEEYRGDPAAVPVGADAFALVAAYPEFEGELRDLSAAAEKAHAAGALLIVQADPIMCSLLKSPGSMGADIVAAEGQALGNPVSFGGPYLGMLGATAKLVRKMPGRIVGEAHDREGRKGYVLTLSAREQHIRREKAVSNICSNQGLVMLRACVYMAAMGECGLPAAARLCYDKAHFAAELIGKLPGFRVENKSFFKEFLVATPRPAEELYGKLAPRSVLPGLPLSRYYPERKNELLVCVTEKSTRSQIELLAQSLKEAAK